MGEIPYSDEGETPLFASPLPVEQCQGIGLPVVREGAFLRVFLVDDSPVVRNGLSLLLQQEGIEVCGAASCCLEAIAGIEAASPDAVVLDLALGAENGMDLIPQIKKKHPSVPILIYSVYEDSYLRKQATAAGASGFVSKQGDPEHVGAGIRAVVRGESYSSLAENHKNQGGPRT